MSTKSPLALIAGPTASGKSALAIALAKRANGVIVNADASQVYRDIPILSAAPTEAERREAEHRLFAYIGGEEGGSAANWARDARREIADIHASGKLPIVVGGTGMYIRTLLDGIAPTPPIDPAIRQQIRFTPVEKNYAKLKEVDAAAAALIKPADSARVARALEVMLTTHKSILEWQKDLRGGIGDSVDLRAIVLLPPREWLSERIGKRFEAMVDNGAPQEVAALLKKNYPPRLPVMQAIGVAAMRGLNEGIVDREKAVAVASMTTRQYAKRQYTWFRNQSPADWPRFEEPLDADGAMDRALDLLSPKA